MSVSCKKKFSGVMSALVTPFDGQGKINKSTVRSMVEHQLASGICGFYICGSTGEGVTMTSAQRREMCETVMDANAGRGKIIVQTGSINCEESFELARHATEAGADGISSVAPSFYYRYTRNEIIDYYTRLAGSTDLPLLLYAVPLVSVENVTGIIEKLLPIENIIGLKDTRADFFEMWKLSRLNNGNINIINGSDECLLCGLGMGADGGIGATYNIMPELFSELYRNFVSKDFFAAQALQGRINRIIQVLLSHAKSSCIGTIKLTLRLRGMDAGTQRYPAEDFTREETDSFKKAMLQAGYDFS